MGPPLFGADFLGMLKYTQMTKKSKAPEKSSRQKIKHRL